MAKTGRNEPCPCGSGRKDKKCCLGNDEAAPSPTEVQLSHPTVARTNLGESAHDFMRDISVGRSARSVAQLLRKKGVSLAPYTVARVREDPRSAGSSLHLPDLMERGMREGWTRKKVAALSTEAIEEHLAALGVKHTRERLLRLAARRNSAWTIAEAWLRYDSVKCSEKEDDFLGLAACELWKRLVPDHPSMEMLDDWMQEGYTLVERGRDSEACSLWWKVWSSLLPRFTPEMRTMNAVADAFNGYQSVFNWSQIFESHLEDAARKELGYAAIGRQYCTEWIVQFPDDEDGMQVRFHRALASFLFRLGETAEMSAVLHQLPEQWPKDVWSQSRWPTRQHGTHVTARSSRTGSPSSEAVGPTRLRHRPSELGL